MLGFLKFVRDFDWTGAEAEFRRALELNPGSADAYDLYGRMLAALGRHDEAIPLEARGAGARSALPPDRSRRRRSSGRVDTRRRWPPSGTPWNSTRSTDGPGPRSGGRTSSSAGSEEGLAELEQGAALTTYDAMFLAQLGEAYGLYGRAGEGAGGAAATRGMVAAGNT